LARFQARWWLAPSASWRAGVGATPTGHRLKLGIRGEHRHGGVIAVITIDKARPSLAALVRQRF